MIQLVGTLVLLLGCPSDLGAPAAPPASDVAARSEAHGEARRILFLASGQPIRVMARERDGAWEYQNRAGWQRLDPRAVVRATLEADALRAWRAERARADLGDPDERARLARSAAERGLATEALADLDVVLASEPDHAGALAVLREHWLLSVPAIDAPGGEAAARAELLRWGASLPRAARELAVAELARATDQVALQAELARELSSAVVARRSFAALALRRAFPGAEARTLLVHAVRDASEDVRRASARALGAAGEPELLVPLVRALASPAPTIRTNAAAAMGEMGYAAAVEPLVARLSAALQSSSAARVPHAHVFFGRQTSYLQDFDVEVAQFQAVADPQVNVLIEGAVLDAAVIGVRAEAVQIELAAIRGALARLTGARPGHTARAWLAWWEEHGETWRAADHARPATKAGAAASGIEPAGG